MKEIFIQNFVLIFISSAVLIAGLVIFKIYKFKKIIESDRAAKEYYENGEIKKDGKPRPIWDYHFFPGLSRIWHKSEWQIALAITILLILFGVYLYTMNDKLFTLLGLNFGIVIGMMINKNN